MSRLDHVKRFYLLQSELESRLGGARRLAECSGRMPWPKRGVCFFMEPGEIRTDSGDGLRLVRVGTHALKLGSSATLWKRLSQHNGQASSGGSNHRGSVFRKIVGSAVIEKCGINCSTWDDGRSTATREVRNRERPLEIAVSEAIGQMPFLWLAAADEAVSDSLRGQIERIAIALLSKSAEPAINPSSASSLGRHCNREKVRNSGLWNPNHVEENYDPAFLDMMADLIGRVANTQ